jgi:hypothetical protein
MLGFGGGFNKSNQESKSESGLRGDHANVLSRDMLGVGRDASTLSRQYAKSPFGYFQGKHVSELVPTNEYGLPTATTGALNSFGNSMFSKASAGGALRGGVQPESTTGVVGSALQGIGQYLIPYINDFQKYMTQLPDQLMSSRLGFLQNTMSAGAPLLGSSSTYKGDSFGFNMNAQVGGKP